jgi:hypothetical protein
VIALVATVDGTFAVDLETEEIEPDEPVAPAPPPRLNLPRVVAAAACGSTVVAVVDAKPPLLVWHDLARLGAWAAATANGRDRRLRPGHRRRRDAQPALLLARRRPLLDRTRGRAAGDQSIGNQGSLNSPRATIFAEPPTSTRSIRSADPSARA